MSGGAGLLRVPRAGEILGNVVACGLDQQQRARVIDAFRSRVAVRFINALDELTAELRATLDAVDIVILPAVDRDGHAGTVERIVRELVVDRPRVAIVAYCPVGAR